MASQFFQYDGDPNGVILGNQGDRCAHLSKNLIYTKTGGSSNTGWIALDTMVGTTGTVLQTRSFFEPTLRTSIADVPVGDAVMQSSQGDVLMTANITPKNSTSTIYLTFSCAWTYSALQQDAVVFGIFRAPVVGALGQVQLGCPQNTQHLIPAYLYVVDQHGQSSGVTYTVRWGRGGGAGTLYVNGTSAGRRGGGAQKATLLISEIVG